MERVLARDSRGETSSREDVRAARADLTPEQLDRFWRASKVWFLPEIKSFEYEDRSE